MCQKNRNSSFSHSIVPRGGGGKKEGPVYLRKGEKEKHFSKSNLCTTFRPPPAGGKEKWTLFSYRRREGITTPLSSPAPHKRGEGSSISSGLNKGKKKKIRMSKTRKERQPFFSVLPPPQKKRKNVARGRLPSSSRSP